MNLSILEILSNKRHGGKHTAEEISDLVLGYCSGEVTDYQMSAWLMAVCINGLDIDETVALTDAMISSGSTISGLPGTAVDKHSTGGVGDKTTLVLAPLLAAAGLTVAKMSGRGLGITGGTIDKLESIPGFRTDLTTEQFLGQARRIGCVITGQTAGLVPADKKIYALRDVTATVDSIPLIAASVMSKKIACGAGVILLDVKVGSGAFMKDIEAARELARAMISIGDRAERRTIAAITDMNEPLGFAVGNAIEVAEAIETLRGGGPVDLRELSLELGAMLLSAAEDAPHSSAKDQLTALLDSGAALSKFRQMIECQGGDPGVVDDPSVLPQAAHRTPICAGSDGYVQSVDAGVIGRAASTLGAGRTRKEDSIDPSAGVIVRKKVGDSVRGGEELALLLSSRAADTSQAVALAESAFRVGQDEPNPIHSILDTLGF